MYLRVYIKYYVITGLPNVFGKFFPGFQNFFKVFKVTRFRVNFWFKIKFKVKTVKNRTLKRYLKASLNVIMLKIF